MDDAVDMLLEDHLTEGEEGIEELAADLGSGGMQNLIDKMFGARLVLATLMNKCRVGNKEIELDKLHMVLEIELELAQIADLEEKKGFENDRSLQARLERIALSRDEEHRGKKRRAA
jgi:hypothetical protein